MNSLNFRIEDDPKLAILDQSGQNGSSYNAASTKDDGNSPNS